MNPLVIEQTESTLGVDFDPGHARLVLRGESYPENAFKFFTPVLAWLEQYLAGLGPGAKVGVEMDIVYFNSSSSKALMNVFDTLEAAARTGVEVSIDWLYHAENEIALDCGEEFAEELTACAFDMKAYGGAS